MLRRESGQKIWVLFKYRLEKYDNARKVVPAPLLP